MTDNLRKQLFNLIVQDDFEGFRILKKEHTIENLEAIYNDSIIASCGDYNAINICKYLYSLGVSLEHTYNEFDRTCLYRAVSNGCEELTNWLLKNAANPNGNFLTYISPLTSVLYNIEKLLKQKLSDIHNNNPIKISQGYGQLDLILDNPEYLKLKRIIINLLEYGADPNIMIHSSCKTPLDECYYSNNQDIAKVLKKYGAGYAHLNIEDTDKKNNQVLLKVNEHLGKIFSVYFIHKPVKNIELMVAAINEDYRVKLLITNGLYNTKLNSEIGFIVSCELPIAQQMIDKDDDYAFFEKLPLLIADQVYHSKIELFEGLIIQPSTFPEVKFPNNLNALMLIKKNINDVDSIWLLVPIKYPRSRKFTSATLNKFIDGLKKKKWYRLAYILEKDSDLNYLPIFND